MYNTIKKYTSIAMIFLLSLPIYTSASADFYLTEVKVNSYTSLTLSFSNELEEFAEDYSEFKINPKNNPESELIINSISKDGDYSLILNLQDELVSGEEYELVVLLVSDKDFNIIESGVDGYASFEAIVEDIEVELNTAENEVIEEELVENIEEVEYVIVEEITEVNEEISEEENEVSFNAAEAGEDLEALPQTGAKETLMILLALLLAFGLLYTRKRA